MKAIESLIPLIKQHVDAADEQCYLTNEVAEAIAEVDGGTGWNLMIGIELLGIASVTFPNDKATLLFSEPHFILAGALISLAIAVAEVSR